MHTFTECNSFSINTNILVHGQYSRQSNKVILVILVILHTYMVFNKYEFLFI